MFWRNMLPPSSGYTCVNWKNVRLCGRGGGKHLARQEIPSQRQVRARGDCRQTCEQEVQALTCTPAQEERRSNYER